MNHKNENTTVVDVLPAGEDNPCVNNLPAVPKGNAAATIFLRGCALPAGFERTRRAVLAVGLAAVFVGVLALTSSALPSWIGAAACVVGSHRVRTALRIPTTT